MKRILCTIVVFLIALCMNGCNNCECNKPSDTTTNNDNIENSQANTESGTLVVPNLVGMDKDEAVKLLEGMGFETKLEALGLFANFKDHPDWKDSEIVSQNVLPGRTRPLKTVVTMQYATGAYFDEYEENADGTITLTMLSEWYSEEHILKIPKTYEGKTVSCIKDEALPKTLDPYGPFAGVYTVQVPKDVKVEVDVDYDLVRY